MKRLPAAKRNQLIMVVVATIALIGLVYFLLIGPQKTSSVNIAIETKTEQGKLQQMENVIKMNDATSNTLADISLQLSHAEEDLASGDVYAWTYDTIRRFNSKSTYHVDLTIGQSVLGDVDLIPNFPYKQVRVSLNGTAYYHDLGKFIADFENNFPHMRMLNLSLEPAGTPGAASERLTFRVDAIALVKPNT